MSLELEKFNPTIAELNQLVETSQRVSLPDLSDTEQLKVVKSNRIYLRDARVAITKRGKELRQEAVDFQKAVIEKEKELVAIIEPEELRLKDLEEKAAEFAEMEKRKELLPIRRGRLAELLYTGTDEDILRMDDKEFEAKYNELVAAKNEAGRILLEERERTVREAEEKITRENEMRAREERARQEERERAEQREKERIEREARAKREAEERADREKLEAQTKEREERERLEKEGKYKMWLATNGWTEETKSDFIIEKVGNKIRLCKILAIYTIE